MRRIIAINDISEIFKRHDKYQFEMKFTYPVSRNQKLSEYFVDTYFFLPASLDINSSTYSAETFYTDSRDYIRLKTPEFKLDEICGDETSPLGKLSSSIAELGVAGRPESQLDIYAARLKMFCSIMKSSLRDAEYRLEQTLTLGDENLNGQLEFYFSASSQALTAFRRLESRLEAPDVPEEAAALFRHGDEFLSLVVNKYRYKLFLALEPLRKTWSREVQKKLVQAVKEELAYRKKRRYPSIPSLNGDNEEMVYREGVLKKAMAGVLFLKTDTSRDGVVVQNVIFGFAAGLAMLFATLFAYFTQSMLIKDFSLMFVLVMVAAYMGKDRIKELSRAYMYSKARRFLYDYKTAIYDSAEQPIGITRESFNFIAENDVPEAVRNFRNRAYLTKLENGSFGEKVILARRRVQLYSKSIEKLFRDFEVNGVVDIMRFNVRNFLMRMDNPSRPIFMPDDKNNVRIVNGKRVYHVNIVVCYGTNGQRDRYVRYRLVLSRKGIERIIYITNSENTPPRP